MTKLLIPEAALGQHIAILGKTGSGKTFTAKGLIEHLLEQGRRVGIVDPTDAWWGLRSSRSGKGPGFPILVLGGEHGDLPLPALGGAAVARLLIEQGVNLVASTKHLTVGERTRWFIDFAGTISRLNRSPLHLVIDEAHNFAPQGKVPDPDTGKMLHAANALASGGRSIGVRLVMITQRPQKLHKDTLTSADTLIAMRVLAPHDREAVEDWIDGCGDPKQGKEVLNSLASLKRGEGWAWYPEGEFLERLKFPMIETFDSSATPQDGKPLEAPKGAADIDLSEIKAAMADAVREAEANDPKLLRSRIAELERAAKKGDQTSGAAKAEIAPAYRRGFDAGRLDGQRAGYAEGYGDALQHAQTRLDAHGAILAAGIAGLLRSLKPPRQAGRAAAPTPSALPAKASPQSADRARLERPGAFSGVELPKGERRILTAIAQHADGVTREQLTVLTGYKKSSRDTYLNRLRERGVISIADDRIQATELGVTALGPDFRPLPTGEELREHWLVTLPEGERKILSVLIDAYPKPIEREEISEKTGYLKSSRDTYLQRLKSRRLAVHEGRGQVRASDQLFS